MKIENDSKIKSLENYKKGEMMKNKKNFSERINFVRYFLPLGLVLLIMACGTGKNAKQSFDEVKKLISSREFEIENQWAMPLRGGNVNLIGNSNHIRFKGDSVDVFLPYFGVRHSGGGYGSEGGIKFEGSPEDLKIRTLQEEEEIKIDFGAQDGAENFEFHITIFENGDASTSVTTSQRESISYRGSVEALPESLE